MVIRGKDKTYQIGLYAQGSYEVEVEAEAVVQVSIRRRPSPDLLFR
jgi:hypothetical protein